MKTEQELTQSIMRRVYGVYILRQISAPAVRATLLIVLALALKELVSITSVFQNMSTKHDIGGFVYYALSAFAETDVLVQLTLVVATAVVLWSIRDVLNPLLQRNVSYV